MEQAHKTATPEPSRPKAEDFYSQSLAGRTRASDLDLDGSNVAYWSYEPVHRAEHRSAQHGSTEHGSTKPNGAGHSGAEHNGTEHPRTILVIHGFRGDHHGLLRVVDQLPDMRIIMPDLPGFGSSESFANDEHSVERYGRFIESFMAALGLGPDTVLLGHSFGSIIASHFVATHPGAVRPLILVNPIAAPALEGPKGLMTKLAVLYYRVSARLPRRLGLAVLRNRVIVRMMSVAMAKTRDRRLRSFIHGQHDAYFSAFADRRSLLEAFRASVSGNVADVAPGLNLPVLLIAGEKDEIATLPDQHKLLELLPDGRLDVIPGVGHLIHYETPAAAAAHIRTFLEDHPA